MDNKNRIVFFNYIPSPYRVDFFNELAKIKCFTSSFYYASIENSQQEKEEKVRKFDHLFLFNESKVKGYLNLFKLI